jgi:two-component system, cell cycle sensor histidine kinase and response regulator CckA
MTSSLSQTNLQSGRSLQVRMLEHALDQAQDGYIILSGDREILSANIAAHKLLAPISEFKIGEVLDHVGTRSLAPQLSDQDSHRPIEIALPTSPPTYLELNIEAERAENQVLGWTIKIHDVSVSRVERTKFQELDRLAAVGQLATGIAHDFNNIMGAVILYSELLIANPELNQKEIQWLKTILEQGKRAAGLTRQILDFSRSGLMEPHRIDLAPFLEKVQKLLARTLPENIQLRLALGRGNYVVNIDPVRLQQLIMNLSVNARDGMPYGGEICFVLDHHIYNESNPPPFTSMINGAWVSITVQGTRQAGQEGERPRFFEPFFTTKASGKTSSFGLAQFQAIVEPFDGIVREIEPVSNHPATVIYLPSRDEGSEEIVIPGTFNTTISAHESLLIVEDDPPTREALEQFLRAHDYKVLTAPHGKAALELIDKLEGDLDLVISDMVMPGLDGMTLYHHLRESFPKIKFVIMTGYPIGTNTQNWLEKVGIPCVTKPLRSHHFMRTIREQLDSS